MSTQIQLRRGTAAQWTTANPTLAEGELGLETDTGKFKFGDGLTAWTGLSYGAGTGNALTSNPLSQFASTTSAQLRGVMSDETGTGALVFAGGNIGAATATSINGLTLTTSTGTVTITDGKTLAVANTVTITGTDGSTLGVGSGVSLTAFGGLSLVADRLPYADGTGTLALATFTAAGRALLDDADAAAQRKTLGLSSTDSPTFNGITCDTIEAATFDGVTIGVILGLGTGVKTLLEAAADGSAADGPGYRGVPANAQTGNYTLVMADNNKHIYHASGAGSGDTYTIPANASVAFPVGAAVTFVNMDSNAVSIAITSDTLYLAGTGTTGTRTLAQYGIATAVKLTSTTWLISGSGLT